MKFKLLTSLGLVLMATGHASAQLLQLSEAIQRATESYDALKAKQSLHAAAAENTAFLRQLHLPDFHISAQQSYGTVNMIHGPMLAGGGIASTSMPLAEQNWNAGFGALYLAHINWNVFTFGRVKNQIGLGVAAERTAAADLNQEIFQHQVKVAAAYLKLLACQRLYQVQGKNVNRAQVFYTLTAARAESGLLPEVDAALAEAEVAHARSLQIKAQDKVLDYNKQLAVLMGDSFKTYELDSAYSSTLPMDLLQYQQQQAKGHPLLLLQSQKIDFSKQMESLLTAERRPSLSAAAVLQGRGSGFAHNYAQNTQAFSTAYPKGVGIDRGNYLLGLTLSWNLTQIPRYAAKIKEQQLLTQSLRQQYDGLAKELQAQLQLGEAQLQQAYKNLKETIVQRKAAEQAFKQQMARYENGLSTLVDYTQALYSINRAEIEQEVAHNNVWQALLLLAAAQGDLSTLLPHHKD
ncbi:TolC family protein [Sphingobacterium sp. Mn56C]|uniref:TolC family protein n=1 Tax=Sphingobacterium sp. Mn56C TaxID=3395261 RepID=UPI003BD98BC6